MNRILVVAQHYLPAYKAGGGLRLIANLVSHLGSEFAFYILTSDRDLGDRVPYPGINPTGWNLVDKAYVRYLPPESQSLSTLRALINNTACDVLYTNSFFGNLSVKTAFLRWCKQISAIPFIISPQGDLSPGALNLKKRKKQLYLTLVKQLRWYQGVIWQTAGENETEDIHRMFGADIRKGKSQLHLAPNLPPLSPPHSLRPHYHKTVGELRIIFLSRIDRKKNLDYALSLLTLQKTGTISFDIFGPIEDGAYWQECQAIVRNMPPNISVAHRGVISPDAVVKTFEEYHLFLFPTLGENFGYVVPEAFTGGCIVLTSDQTPWRKLSDHQIGWDIALADNAAFQAALHEAIDWDTAEFQRRSQLAQAYAQNYLHNSAAVEASRRLLQIALKMRCLERS